MSHLRFTYIGGPTALLELGGLRLLTDPTFDPARTEYRTPVYVLRKTQDPALALGALGPIDVVLLSHDHHFDNLDQAGRRLLEAAGRVLTTVEGAARLGRGAVGLLPWQSHDLPARDGHVLRVTATPARHGPTAGDRGPVIGFMLELVGGPGGGVYVSGDSVWYEGMAEVARRFRPEVLVLFCGAARVPEVGPDHLTLTAREAVTAARAFPGALVVPVHFEGWAHFSESRKDIERAFDAAGMAPLLRWPAPGVPVSLPDT
jgi:L-ascorbate metabolism protein UlaG (beta-lactamase superfamily)